MMSMFSKCWSSRFARGARVYLLVAVVLAIFDTSTGKMLVSDSLAQCRPACTGNQICNAATNSCTTVPEIPALALPLFLLAASGGFYTIRRRSLRAMAIAA